MNNRQRIFANLPTQAVNIPGLYNRGFSLGQPSLGRSWLLEYFYIDLGGGFVGAKAKNQVLYQSSGGGTVNGIGNTCQLYVIPQNDPKLQKRIEWLENFMQAVGKSYSPPLWIAQEEQLQLQAQIYYHLLPPTADKSIITLNITPTVFIQYQDIDDPNQNGGIT